MLRRLAYPVYEKILETEITHTPNHVAVIQDGNRRFARRRGEDPSKGHIYGAQTTESLLEWSGDLDIQEVTLYTFSTENFNRPDNELQPLFDLMEEKLGELTEDDRVHENEIRIRGIGEVSLLPERVQEALHEAEEITKDYDSYILNLAVGYGGRNELLNATKEIMKRVQEGKIEPGDIDKSMVSNHLYTGYIEEIDLIIRTGGDERLSNFLPWQAKGNESMVYFCAPYWPEFRKIDFLRALRTYGDRKKQRETRDLERAEKVENALDTPGFDDFVATGNEAVTDD